MKKAFSLIELSIVILIIGILIAGVTQSSRLISAMRLQTARQLTQSAPVTSIKDLSLWLEASLENSFLSTEQEDGAFLTRWNDINPQTTSKNNLTRGSSNARISFKSRGINDIPAVYFDGTSSSEFLSGTVISTSTNAYSIFLVLRLDDNPPTADTNRYAFVNGNSASSGISYAKRPAPDAGKRIASFNGTSWNHTTTANSTINPEIIRITGNASTVNMWVNGAAQTLDAPTGSYIAPSGNVIVGNATNINAPWYGLISEVIFFERILKNEESTSIESYLAKKYNIKI